MKKMPAKGRLKEGFMQRKPLQGVVDMTKTITKRGLYGKTVTRSSCSENRYKEVLT